MSSKSLKSGSRLCAGVLAPMLTILFAVPMASAQKVRFEAGPVLSVYLLQGIPDAPNDQRGAMAPAFIAKPSSMAIGEALPRHALFSAADFTEDDALSAFHSADVGLSWDGYLLLDEPGEHLISMQLHTKGHTIKRPKRLNPVCSASVTVDGKTVASVHKLSSSRGNSGNRFATSATRYNSEVTVFADDWRANGKVEAQAPGLYEATVWLACLGVRHDKVSVSVHVKGQADVSPEPVTRFAFLRL